MVSAMTGPIRHDAVAGATVWAVLIPESLAYATIAGVSPVVGLYAAIPALVLYAALGSSRHLVVGPMSGTAALSASVVAGFAAAGTAAFTAHTVALAMVVGGLALVAGLCRLGFLSAFISEPVLKGFIIGLALTIIVGQVPDLIGVEKPSGSFVAKVWGILRELGSVHGLTFLVGGLALVSILVLHRFLPLVPGALIVVVLGIAAVHLFELDHRGVEIVGHIPAGLPRVSMPDLRVRDYLDMVGPAVGLMLICFVEGLGAAKTYAARGGYDIDANAELRALGAANLGAGLFGGMVVNGTLSKTAVNVAAGARTKASGLVVAGLTLVTLLFLTGFFAKLPEAVLAAVVIAAVHELVDLGALRRLYDVWTGPLGRIYSFAARIDFIAAMGALLGVLIFDTIPGLFIGISLSLLTLLYRTSRPHVPLLGRSADTGLWLDLDRHEGLERDPRVPVLRVESALFFANADHVRDRVRAVVDDRTAAVILDASTTPSIDVSGASMLAQLRADLARRDTRLLIAHQTGQVRDVVARTAEEETVEQALYATVDQAHAAATRGLSERDE